MLSLMFRGGELAQQIIVLAFLCVSGEGAENLKNVHLYNDFCSLGIKLDA